jgi:O-antigen/teichoic acid export membrane protein
MSQVNDEATASPPEDSTGFRRAVSWSYALNVGRIFTTLGLSLLLARLLGPEAFGLIAMANVYVMFVEMLVRQGLFVAVVQRPGLTLRQLDTAFWLTSIAVILLTPTSILLSGPWARLNRVPELAPLIIALSALILLRGLSVVQEARFHRQMDFKLLALRGNAAVLVGGAVGLTLALMGAGVWSLVAQQLVTAMVEAAVIWHASDWRPRRQFDRSDARQLLSFGSKNAAASLGNFANHRADALLIGLFFGPVSVGLYRMAARLVETMLDFAIGGLQTVALPELSRFTTEIDAFKRRTLELMGMVAAVAAPAFATLAVTSDALFRLLGPEWTLAADPLKVMALLGFVAAVFNLSGPILDASGRPGRHAVLMWIGAAVSVATFTAAGFVARRVAEQDEVFILAALRTVTFVLAAFLVSVPMLRRALGLTFGQITRASSPAFFGAGLGAAAATVVVAAIDVEVRFGAFVSLLLTSVIAAVMCLGGVAAADGRSRRLAITVLRRGVSGLRSPHG